MRTLQEISEDCDTDKGTDHTYIEVYEELFSKIRHEPISILEIGVLDDGSMRMWNEYFDNDDVSMTGMDIDTEVKSEYAEMFYGDQAVVDLSNLRFDLIIDDGNHSKDSNVKTYHNLIGCLKPEGIYVIEDVDKCPFHVAYLEKHGFYIVDMSDRGLDGNGYTGRYDNVLAILDTRTTS